MKSNYCLLAMPCNFNFGGAAPAGASKCEIKSAKAENPVCSHVRFSWELKDDAACKDVK